MRRILIISDTHCGHETGLTHPDYQWKMVHDTDDPDILRRNKIAKNQYDCWEWYTKTIESLHPIDTLFHLGDCIEGKGSKTGSSELITADIDQQCDMAAKCIKIAKAEKIIMLYGSPYHTGDQVDWENQIAKTVGADKIGGREFVKVDNIVFDLKHKVGKTSIPHGQGTMLAKEWLWNEIWSQRNQKQPLADIYLRGHAHDYFYIGSNDWLAMAVPALCWSTKFGARQCTGMVKYGLVWFDVEGDNFSYSSSVPELDVLNATCITI